MNPQEQNWHNFCQHHEGDWHGTWTRYSPEGKNLESFQCIRSLKVSKDRREIYHQNHYIYAEDKKETKLFGPYQKQTTSALFLDKSFSWGSKQIESGANFFFETGFRYQNRRASLAAIYDRNAKLL